MNLRFLKNDRHYKVFIIVIICTIISSSSAWATSKYNYIRIAKTPTTSEDITKENTAKKPKKETKAEDKTVKIAKDAKNNTEEKTRSMPPWRYDNGLRLAEIQIFNKQYIQAGKTLQNVLKRHPRNADAYTYIGITNMAIDLNKEAKKNFELAIKISPDHMGAHVYMGLLALEASKPKIALEWLQAIKVLCKAMSCAEEIYLSNKINKYKKPKKE